MSGHPCTVGYSYCVICKTSNIYSKRGWQTLFKPEINLKKSIQTDNLPERNLTKT